MYALRRRARNGERGAVAVETALVLPGFLAIIFAIIEFGPLFLNWSATRNAAVTGAQEGTISGASPRADYDILQSMKQSLEPLGNNLDYIIVFRAKSIKDAVPAECIAEAESHRTADVLTAVGYFDGGAGGSNVAAFNWGTVAPRIACNVYYRRSLALQVSPFIYDKFTTGLPSLDSHWPAGYRVDFMDGPQDFVGVYVRTKHSSPTGAIPTSALTAKYILQIEPKRASR